MWLGLTATGWRAYLQQRMFIVHYPRRNPGQSLCRVPIPYHHEFSSLPSNAMICERCRHSREAP